MSLFLLSLLVGAFMAAPVGPVGITSIVQTMGGHRRAAFASVAGCTLGEMIFAAVLIAGLQVPELHAFTENPPQWVFFALGVVLMVGGLFMAFGPQNRRPHQGLSFLVAFKITVLGVNNLASLTVVVTLLDLPERLQTPTGVTVFLTGYFMGLLGLWWGLLQLCWTYRNYKDLRQHLPLVRRLMGGVILLFGTIAFGQGLRV